MEALDWDDLGFYPCSCGYQICRFCWHRLKTDENGLCPACRQTFPDIPVSFNPEVSAEELKKQKKRNKERNKTNKEQVVRAQDLATLRVVQKNLVFVIGLSSRLTQEDLKKEFAHFGKIIKFVHNKSTAYVTYSKPEEAIRAIRTLNASAAQESAAQHLQLQQLTNGTNNIITTGPPGPTATTNIVTNPISVPVPPNRLKASLGTTKYCNHFLRSQQCPKVGECMYLHEIAEAEASFTKEQMQAGKHVEYEKKLMDSYFVKPEIQNNSNCGSNLTRQQQQIAMHNQQQQIAMHNQQLPATQLPIQQSQSKPTTALNAVASSNIPVSKTPESLDVFKESNPCEDTTIAVATASAPITANKAWMSTTISTLGTTSNNNSSSSSSSSNSNNNNNNSITNNNATTFHQNAINEVSIFKRSPLLQQGKSFQPLQNQTLNTLLSGSINGFDTTLHEKICSMNKVSDMNNIDGHSLQQHEKTTRSLRSNNTLESPFLNSLRIQTEQPKTDQSSPLDIDSEDDGLDFDPISVSTIGLRDMLMDQQVQQQQALHNTMNLTNHNHRLDHTNSIMDFDSQTLGLTSGSHSLSQQQQQQVTWQNLRNLFPNVNITFNARSLHQASNPNEFSHHQSYLMPTSAASSGDPWPSSTQGTANNISSAGTLNQNHDFFSLAPNSHDDFGSLTNSHNINKAYNVLHTSQQHRDQQLLQHQQQRYLRHVSSSTGSNQSSNMNDPCLTSSVWHSRNN